MQTLEKKIKKRGAFVVCSDEGWALQSAFVLQQALNSDPERLLDYYFACDFDAQNAACKTLFDPCIVHLNLADALNNLDVTANHHVPRQTFLRFFAIDQLSDRYERICYADGDVYLSWGSWTDLFDLPFTDHAISAVLGRSIWYNSPRARYGKKYRAALSLQMGDNYLNAGVLLVDSAKYQSAKITGQVLQFLKDNKELCAHGDQSALNAVLAGNWDELSPSWNWQVSPDNFALLQSFHPRVFHFTGEMKPWNDRYGLYRTALQDLAYFAATKQLDAKAHEFARLISQSPYTSDRRNDRIEKWTSNQDYKLSLMDQYFQRQDFIDVVAGLTPFSRQPSGFGAAPVRI